MVPQFRPEPGALLLIDYQVGTLQLTKTNPADAASRNAITLAEAVLAFDRPVVPTSSQEDQIQSRVDESVQRILPGACKTRMERQGIVDASKPESKKAVERTGRCQLIIGAITTDICLAFLSISADTAGGLTL